MEGPENGVPSARVKGSHHGSLTLQILTFILFLIFEDTKETESQSTNKELPGEVVASAEASVDPGTIHWLPW